MPPAAACCRTKTPVVGVAAISASMTVRPTAQRPERMASASIRPVVRPSRETTSGPSGSPVANALAKRRARSGERLSPMTPRSPDTLMIGSFTRRSFLGSSSASGRGGDAPCRCNAFQCSRQLRTIRDEFIRRCRIRHRNAKRSFRSDSLTLWNGMNSVYEPPFGPMRMLVQSPRRALVRRLSCSRRSSRAMSSGSPVDLQAAVRADSSSRCRRPIVGRRGREHPQVADGSPLRGLRRADP